MRASSSTTRILSVRVLVVAMVYLGPICNSRHCYQFAGEKPGVYRRLTNGYMFCRGCTEFFEIARASADIEAHQSPLLCCADLFFQDVKT